MADSSMKLDGVMTQERCPRCRKRLMANRVGAKWCSNTNCRKYTRNGVQVKMSPEVFELPDESKRPRGKFSRTIN